MPRFPVEEWQANALRVTAFPVAPLDPPEQRGWWLPALGREPEARSVKPRAGVLEESGPLAAPGLPPGVARLVVASNPARVDWQLLPAPTPSPEIDFLGSLPAVLTALIGLVGQWFELETLPPMQRLALGGTAMIPVPGREQGYRALTDYLPAVTIDPVRSMELSYQINRPRQSSSEVPGLGVNRLSKWQVSVLQFLTIPSQQGQSNIGYFLTVELDVNTAADHREVIAPERRLALLRELSNIALEIAENGDQP